MACCQLKMITYIDVFVMQVHLQSNEFEPASTIVFVFMLGFDRW
jgi:hypothetical protein